MKSARKFLERKKKRERDIKECHCHVVNPKICIKNCPVSFEISKAESNLEDESRKNTNHFHKILLINLLSLRDLKKKIIT